MDQTRQQARPEEGGPVPPQTSGSPPSSPAQLSGPDWKVSVRRAVHEFQADKATLVSAGMAFYWFLAVFPAVIAAVGILGLVHAGSGLVADIKTALDTALPGDAAKVLKDAVSNATTRPKGSSLAATIVGLVLALSSASAGMVALQRGMDVAYDVAVERKLVAARMRALVLIVITAVLGGVATAFTVFGKPLGDGLEGHLPFGTGGVFVLVWTVLRWVLGLGALSLLFACFYTYGPNRESPRWTWVSAGGILATVVWLLASLAFSFYVSNLGTYGKTYGSLTGVVVLLLWLYLSAIAVVAGAELNAELERRGHERRQRNRRRRRPPPDPSAVAASGAGASTGTGRTEGRATTPAAPPPTSRGSVLHPSPATGRPVPAEPPADAPSPAPPTPPAPAANSAGASRAAQDAWLSYGRDHPDRAATGDGGRR